MQITIVPVGTGKPGVGDYVAEIEQYLRNRGVEHSLHDMGTIIVGASDELFALAKELHQIPFTQGAERVVTSITLDERTDKRVGLGDKQRSVHTRLEES